PALERAQETFKKKLKKEPKISEASARLRADVEGAKVAEADLIIEAIFENAEAKQALYATLEPKLKPDALLATNTSSIPLDTLDAKLAAPERFLGLHYFNPVALMPLVEIVRHGRMSAQTLERALGFARAIEIGRAHV